MPLFFWFGQEEKKMITNGINGEIRKENECRFNRNIAMICGIRPALIAQYLWEIMEYENGTTEDYWRKMPQKMIQTVYPFLSRHMIRDAMKELTECRILRASERNESRFDRTRWYQFTEYGMELMSPGSYA
jgi:hypothetical protein